MEPLLTLKYLNEVVSIYTDRYDPHNCAVGFIHYVSNNHVLLRHISEYGLADGYLVRCLEDLFHVVRGTQYERKIEYLYEAQNQQHEEFIQQSRLEADSDLFKITVQQAFKRQKICLFNIKTKDDEYSIIGKVQEIRDELIVVDRFTQDGEINGESRFYIFDVDRLFVDSQDERIIETLSTMNKYPN